MRAESKKRKGEENCEIAGGKKKTNDDDDDDDFILLVLVDLCCDITR